MISALSHRTRGKIVLFTAFLCTLLLAVSFVCLPRQNGGNAGVAYAAGEELVWELDRVESEGGMTLEIPYEEEKDSDGWTEGIGMNTSYSTHSYHAQGHYKTVAPTGETRIDDTYTASISWDVPQTIPVGRESEAQIKLHGRFSDTQPDTWWMTASVLFAMEYRIADGSFGMAELSISDAYPLGTHHDDNDVTLAGRDVGLSAYASMDASSLTQDDWDVLSEYELMITAYDRIYFDLSGYMDSTSPTFVETCYYRIKKPGQLASPSTDTHTTTTPGTTTNPDTPDTPDTPTDIEIDTTPTKEQGEEGGWIIPVAIVGVVAVAGGVLVVRRRGNKKGELPDPGPQGGTPGSGPRGGVPAPFVPQQPQQQQQDQQERQPSTFRMMLYKNFGDTLVAGMGQQTVGARIVEQKPDGAIVNRNDLTERITFSVTPNIEAENVGMLGLHKCIYVEVAGSDPGPGASEEAIVAVKFTGANGTFTNNVHFKIVRPRIVFAPLALTFIVGESQTLEMPFTITGFDFESGVEPRWETSVHPGNVGGSGSDYFTWVEVARDAERPDLAWNVSLTETGKASTMKPGEMETFTCSVTAKIATDRGDLFLEGTFDVFRFVEGIRFEIEPIKCYAEAEKGTYVEFRRRRQSETVAEFKAKYKKYVAELGFEPSSELAYEIPEWHEYVRRYHAARTEARVTLFTWGEDRDEQGRVIVRPMNPLPEHKMTRFTFEDVQGASVLKDDNGNDVASPCQQLGFVYLLHNILPGKNEQVFHIIPQRGILVPPNRTQVDVTVHIKWRDREFTATQRVNAVSMPLRPDWDQREAQYLELDARRRRTLEHIQEAIFSSEWNTITLGGKVGLVDTFTDVVEGVEQGAKERWDGMGELVDPVRDAVLSAGGSATAATADAASSVSPSAKDAAMLAGSAATAAGTTAAEAAGAGAKAASAANPFSVAYDATSALIKSVYKQLTTWRTISFSRYGELMPLYHQIETMLQGYSEYYGFHEPDFQRACYVFLAYSRGEMGTAQAAELALYGRDLEYCDAVRMTVKDWNNSWTMIGVRIGFSLFTAGQSEWLFTPLAAIGKGMEASIDYIDSGGYDDYKIFRVGRDAAAWEALIDIASGKALEYAMGWAGFFKGVAESLSVELGAEASWQRMLGKLTSAFNSGTTAAGIHNAVRGVGTKVSQGQRRAKESLKRFAERSSAEADELLERDIAYTLGRIEGKAKLQELRRLVGEGAEKLTEFERRQIIYAIQCDKHAMRALMAEEGKVGQAARKLFNKEIREVQELALDGARESIAAHYKVNPENVRLKAKVSGNSADDLVTGKRSAMDLDATYEVRTVDEFGVEHWDDVDEAVGQRAFDAELYRVVHGEAALSEAEAAAFGKAADHSIVSMTGKESYGTLDDAMRVVDKSRAGEPFEDALLVGEVAEYKCVHWLDYASEAAQAAAMERATNPKAAAKLAQYSEAYVEESVRQFTKQADRIIYERYAILQSRGIEVKGIEEFIAKVDALKQCGIEKACVLTTDGYGFSPANAEQFLAEEFGSSLRETYAELSEFTQRMDILMRQSS